MRKKWHLRNYFVNSRVVFLVTGQARFSPREPSNHQNQSIGIKDVWAIRKGILTRNRLKLMSLGASKTKIASIVVI